MSEINKAILAIDQNISKNISKFDDSERGLLSQNILRQFRNLVELIFLKYIIKEKINLIKQSMIIIELQKNL